MRSSGFDWWVRAQDSVAQGALTNSKHPDSHIFGVYPTHLERGYQGYVVDTNKKTYVDYICGLGSTFLGYSPPPLVEKLSQHLLGGFSHSLPTKYEVLAAEALKSMHYFVDKWKFVKTGSEGCLAAIKIARAYQESKGRITKNADAKKA